MQQVRTIKDLRDAVRSARRDQDVNTIGLVPTMGALHAGHLSLVEHSRQQCDVTIASIFVNPKQFAAGEDLGKYPKPLQDDLQALEQLGTDIVFLPSEDEIYPAGYSCRVTVPDVGRKLEGESRPSHFGGVVTVVMKLFQMTMADVAFFGQKDYQQCLVVKHMVRDLNVPIDIQVCPTVRDPDGLAMSSRNVYLSDQERQAGLSLSRTLRETQQAIVQGDTDGRALMAEMTQSLIEGGVTETDYAVVADPDTLELMDTVTLPAVLLVAAKVGTTRLLDNFIVE